MPKKVSEGTWAKFLMTSGTIVGKVAEAVKDMKFEINSTSLSKE